MFTFVYIISRTLRNYALVFKVCFFFGTKSTYFEKKIISKGIGIVDIDAL